MSLCAHCGAAFLCGMADGVSNEPCWCTTLPVIAPEILASLRGEEATNSCFCLACLRAALLISTKNNPTGKAQD